MEATSSSSRCVSEARTTDLTARRHCHYKITTARSIPNNPRQSYRPQAEHQPAHSHRHTEGCQSPRPDGPRKN